MINGMRNPKEKHILLDAVMDGISNIVPITIVSGLFLAISNSFAFHSDHGGKKIIWGFPAGLFGEFLEKLFEIGQIGFILMIPLFCMYVAKSIGGKNAMIPAFIGGYLVNSSEFLETKSGAGFVGALIIGIFVGYSTQLINRIKWPPFLTPLAEFMIIPMILTFITFLLVYYVVGHPLVLTIERLYHFMNDFTKEYTYAPVVYGSLLGAMVGFDLGGPVNKTASLVSSAIFIDTMNQFGIEGVNAIPQAATAAAISVAPLGLGLSTLLFKEFFSIEERTLGNSALIMGLFGISEASIPFIIKYPKLIIANTFTSAVAGGAVALMRIQFFGGIGSPLGAVVGYTSGPSHAPVYWVVIILVASILNSLIYRWILKVGYS